MVENQLLGETSLLIKLLVIQKKVISKLMNSGKLSGFVGAWCDEFYGGKMVRELEERWKDTFKCKFAISLNSNTSGLIAALGATACHQVMK